MAGSKPDEEVYKAFAEILTNAITCPSSTRLSYVPRPVLLLRYRSDHVLECSGVDVFGRLIKNKEVLPVMMVCTKPVVEPC
jgi:hypothetical protein